jgi:hypothetical protein
MMPTFIVRGRGQQLEVYEDKVGIVPGRGLNGLMTRGLSGPKTISFSSITALEHKKAGLANGFLQFVTWAIFWIFFSGIAAVIASSKGRSGIGFFMLSFFLSPLIGIVAALVANSDTTAIEQNAIASGDQKKCPFCAELTKREAVECRFCGSENYRPRLPARRESQPLATELLPQSEHH